MLALDSTAWSELSHAYGPAVDTPDLLRRIYSNPSHDDWSDLYGTVAHQGSISNAAYAAAPHVVAAAEAVPKHERLSYVIFVAFLVLGYDKRPVPDTLKREYDQSVERARELALELVQLHWDHTEAVYLLQAIAALSGKIAVGRIIEGLADEEFQLDCPVCAQHLFVATGGSPFTIFAADPIRSPEAARSKVTSRKLSPGVENLTWLETFAVGMGQSRIQSELESLNGDCECPNCGDSFPIFKVLADAAD